MMTPKISYVADHVTRLEERHQTQNSILDSKWRIASCVDLFPYGELAENGTLTPQQLAAIDQYIAKFKATPAGKEAIAFYQRKAS
jgi:hypothetical protein